MLSPVIAAHLRDEGHDVIAVAESRNWRQSPDDEIFALAQRESRTVVTKNIQDFRPLGFSAIERGDQHAGLVLISNRRFPAHDPHVTGKLISSLRRLLETRDDLTNSEFWLT